MSLLSYESKFSQLNPYRAKGKTSPHKIAMLLAVMDLVESGEMRTNEIYFGEKLRNAFTHQFTLVGTDSDRNSPHLPFFHLRSEGFWHHKIKPGKKESYSHLTTASGPGVIKSYIEYAYIDDELFELINNYAVRKLLRTALYKNLALTPIYRQSLLNIGKGWDWLECEACVKDYFDMLFKELIGESFNKAEHRRALLPMLNNRTESAIEFMHQNISAILVEMGYPYISGYKPAFNYQQQLKDTVFAYLAASDKNIENLSSSADDVQDKTEVDWGQVYDDEVPECITSVRQPERPFIARKINYAQREANNKKLGELGEQFVVEYEKYRLKNAGRSDLAKEVEWSSDQQGDGLGYDVRSFDLTDEKELFIEVKTTNNGKFQSFFMTENEVAFSKERSEQYSLYRVYNFKTTARFFRLEGAVDGYLNLIPSVYKASFR